MRFIYFKAPFAAFRPFKSFELCPTADFITHSAAYGLLLGLAGIEREDKESFADARIVIGRKHPAKKGRIFQQLIDGKRELAHDEGGDFNLRPFWREVLYDLEGYVGLDHPALEEFVDKGIRHPSTLSYWGLPFMGDNNFLLERAEIHETPTPCRWFDVYKGEKLSRRERLHYLSVWTDYNTGADSRGLLFFLTEEKESPPETAWISLRHSGGELDRTD